MMNRKEAMDFITANQWAIMCTFFPNGRPQLTPIIYGVMGGKIHISCTRPRKKTQNLLKNPNAILCITTPKFFGDYLTVEGRVEVLDDPDAALNLALYEATRGQPPEDVEAFRAQRIRDERIILEMSIDRMYPVS